MSVQQRTATGRPEPEAPDEPREVPPGPSRREQRKTETRERIAQAASELFVSKGYDETSFDDVAQVAGVARQTVFNHFACKEDFVRDWGARRRAETDKMLASDTFVGQPATARLILILRVLADVYERAPVEGRVFTTAWVKWGGPILEEPTLGTQFAAVIAEGQRAGEIRDDLDPEVAGQLVRAAYFDALWRWAAPQPRPGAPSLFSAMLSRLEVILTGLAVAHDVEGLRLSVRLALSIEGSRQSSARGAGK